MRDLSDASGQPGDSWRAEQKRVRRYKFIRFGSPQAASRHPSAGRLMPLTELDPDVRACVARFEVVRGSPTPTSRTYKVSFFSKLKGTPDVGEALQPSKGARRPRR